nr:hypothetical protein [uncultured Porphyromonas sp.]
MDTPKQKARRVDENHPKDVNLLYSYNRWHASQYVLLAVQRKRKKRDEEKRKYSLCFIPDRKHFEQTPKSGARIVRVYSPLPSEKKEEKR